MVTVHVDVCLARRVASLRRLWIFILVLCVTREWTSHRGLKGNYVGAAGGEWLGEWDAVEGGVGVDAGGLEETPATTSPRSVVRRSPFLVSTVLCRATKRISPDARASERFVYFTGKRPTSLENFSLENLKLSFTTFLSLCGVAV